MDNVFTKHRWLQRITAAGAAPVLLAGCSGGGEPARVPQSSPNLSAPSHASTAPSASGQDERQAVEAAYTEFWPRSLAIPNTPEDTWREAMAAIAVDPQLTTTLKAMHRNKQVGVKPYGDVTTRISRIEVHGNRATVIDCQDGSRSGQADAVNGDRKTVGSPAIPIHAQMVRDPAAGRWKVSHLEYPGGPC